MRTHSICGLMILAMGLSGCEGNGGSGGVGSLSGGIYETREEIPTALGSVTDYELVDLNGDRILDLVAVSVGGELQILFGQGNGSFSPAQPIAITGRPTRVVARDLDLDTDLDVLVLRPQDERISVFVNNGSGGLDPRPDITTCPNAVDMDVGECTGDLDPDVVVVHSYSVDVLVFNGFGGGFFGGPAIIELVSPSNPTVVRVADVDRDDVDDLVIAEAQRSELQIYPGLVGGGHGTPDTYPIGLLPTDIAIGDLDRDLTADIAVACEGSLSLHFLFRTSNGFAQASRILGDPPKGLAIGDAFGGDGIHDLIVTLVDRATAMVLPGQPDTTLGDEIRLDAVLGTSWPKLGDVDGDGQLDLLVSGIGSSRVDLFRGRDPRLRGVYSYSAGFGSPVDLVAADLSGDGVPEIAASGGGSPFVSALAPVPGVAPGLTGLEPVLVAGLGRPVSSVRSGDLDGDGRVDLLACTDRGVKALVNAGAIGEIVLGAFPADPDAVLSGGLGPFDAEIGDLDGDGRADLVYTDGSLPGVQVLLARDDPFEYEAFSFTVPVTVGPRALAVGDFTGDGIEDVALPRGDRAFLSVLANDGEGRVTPVSEVPILGGAAGVRSADFDLDGRMDLVVSNGSASEVLVLLSRSAGQITLTLPTVKAARAILVADLNGDEAPDIVVASATEARFAVLLGDGAGGFPTQRSFAGTAGATAAAVVDVDGDDLLDLIVGSAETGRVSVYRAVP